MDDEILMKYFLFCNSIHTLWNKAPEVLVPIYKRFKNLNEKEKEKLYCQYMCNKEKVEKIMNDMIL